MAKGTTRPFIGCDGEGCGRNRRGQQHFKLLRIGPAELYTGRPLSTLECLDFICDADPAGILVGFSFGYDTTQILRDLPMDRLARLFADKEAGPGKSRYTYFEDFGIEYLPKNYLRVCRLRRHSIRMDDGSYIRACQRVPGSSRTIYETFGFFQMSFLKALQAFGVGRAHWPMIERMKSARASFEKITREIRRYNELECALLAELMETFRDTCHGAGLRPRTWNGAGKLSAAMHNEHGTITADELIRRVDDGVLRMASDAYYGGRFEVTRTGEIAGPVYEYDIGSAYPAAMLQLPCLLHGAWEPTTPAWLRRVTSNGGRAGAIFVASVQFEHPEGNAVCGLPIRTKEGRLIWPRRGAGIYWSQEIRSAMGLGARITWGNGWRYVHRCQCHSFDWISPVFNRRRALGKDQAGYPLKLGLNSLYGKLAQRIGNPRWGNMIWAGMITAIVRAWLNDAAAQAPDAIIMMATDALFSKRRLKLPIGEGLGQWEMSEHARLFVVQPGIYWGAKRPKTRGIAFDVFTQHTGRFEKAWVKYASYARYAPPPIVAVPMTLFIGLRLAFERNRRRTEKAGQMETMQAELAGIWQPQGEAYRDRAGQLQHKGREYSFDWSRKRGAHVWETPLCVRTWPLDVKRDRRGNPDPVSVPHKANAAWSQLNLERMEFDDQPDHVSFEVPR